VSFSSDLRDELATIAPRRACCRLAEVSALFHAAGTWHLHGRGELAVHVDLASSAAARRTFALLRELGVRSEIRTYRRTAFDHATRYQLHVELDRTAQARLREAGVVSAAGAPLEQPPKRVVGRSCCRGAYVRGALLGSGSLSGPAAPQLEIRTSGLAGARFLAWIVEHEGIALRVLERRSHALAYTKRAESIADLLALAGASETALRLDEHAVVAATRADANRLANADEGNLLRTAVAAQQQLEAIERLGTKRLPDKLREIADLRTKHPSLSLAELAKKCRPPITKAAAHHRMAVLRDLAHNESGRNNRPGIRAPREGS
jgi:DNA-binding protein WhiA